MNHKHFACAVIGSLIALMMWVTMNVQTKMAAMEAEKRQAETAANNATATRQAKENALSKLKVETAGIRAYLERWTPFLKLTESQDTAELRLIERIKQGGLVVLNQRYQILPVKKGSHIKKMLRGTVTFEDDFARCMQWLGSLEQHLPASRVTTCRMSKGQNENDLKMELTIDVPLTGAEDDSRNKS